MILMEDVSNFFFLKRKKKTGNPIFYWNRFTLKTCFKSERLSALFFYKKVKRINQKKRKRQKKVVYKARFQTFKYFKNLNLLDFELISLLNGFYKKTLRDPTLYEKEIDKLNTVLSEKFDSNFSQRVLLAINVEVLKIYGPISKKHFIETVFLKVLEQMKSNKFFLFMTAIGITFLIRPFDAFAGQDSPREFTKKLL